MNVSDRRRMEPPSSRRRDEALLPQNFPPLRPLSGSRMVPNGMPFFRGPAFTSGAAQGRGRSPEVSSEAPVRKALWTSEEDSLLRELVEQHGTAKWALIATKLNGKLGKQCRERWHNHLRPDIKKEGWSQEEERLLVEGHKKLGNRWAEISRMIPGRTENGVKNHWNTARRKLASKRRLTARYGFLLKPTLLQEYISRLASSGDSPAQGDGRSNILPEAGVIAPGANLNDSDDLPGDFRAFFDYSWMRIDGGQVIALDEAPLSPISPVSFLAAPTQPIKQSEMPSAGDAWWRCDGGDFGI